MPRCRPIGGGAFPVWRATSAGLTFGVLLSGFGESPPAQNVIPRDAADVSARRRPPSATAIASATSCYPPGATATHTVTGTANGACPFAP